MSGGDHDRARGSGDRLRAVVAWLHDPRTTSHPRYRAWERRQILTAVRAAATTLAVVLVLDAILLLDEVPGLWLVNGAGAVAALAVLATARRRGDGRRSPIAGAWTIGAIGLATTLLPIALLPSAAGRVLAHLPILIVGAALFVPWTLRWHVSWLLATLAVLGAFAASPLAGSLTVAGRQEFVSLAVSAALVSFAGHTVLQRERRRAFEQRMQLRGLTTTARRQRREMAALAAQLETVARRDPLTGIGNRLRLDDDVAALRSAGREIDGAAAAVLLDIDHFKPFNDRHGHLAGDAVLRDVARAIAVNVRPTDRVYRFGGEEFLVLLEGTDPATAEIVAERVRRAVEQLGLAHPDNAPWGVVTVSAGVAAVALADAGPDAWLRQADERLYAAKAAGRNRVTGTQVSGAPRPMRRPAAEPAA